MSLTTGLYLLLLWINFGDPTTNESMTEVENRVIANRLAPKKWHVKVMFTKEREHARQDPNADEAIGYISYVDGERSRWDRIFRYRTKNAFDSSDTYTETTIWNEKECIEYSTRHFDDGDQVALSIADRNWVLSEETNGVLHIADVRKLAMFPGGLFIDHPMTQCIGNPDRTDLSMTDDVCNGIACKKLSFIERKLPTRMWVAPSMGYSIVRMEHDWKTDSNRFIDHADIVVKEYEDTGIWFPVSAEWRRVQDDKVTKAREAMQVEVISLNQSLDPKLFSISALNVPRGKFVNRRPFGGNYIWDGQQVRAEKYSEVVDNRATDIVKSKSRIGLLISASSLAVLCGVILWKYFAKR